MIPVIENLPRLRLGFFPTPISDAQRLSSVLNGPRILIKREDLTGLALGGNKCRMQEFILGYAKEQGYDALVSTASSQSNTCVQAAAIARMLGMKPCFVLLKGVHNETQGNLLLHEILESDIEILDFSDMTQLGGTYVSEKLDAVADRLRSEGYKPFIFKHNLPDIAAVIAPVGWVSGADELAQQLRNSNVVADYVVLANAGGATQGGLTLGLKLLGAGCRVMGFSVLRKAPDAVAATIQHANATSKYLGLDTLVEEDDVEIHDDYVGDLYGVPDRECVDAIRLVAQTEGIFLDPVYTGRAMAGLIDSIKKGRFKRTDTVVFIHTGGTAALFAYNEEIARSR